LDIGGNVNTYYTNTKYSGDSFAGVARKNQVSTGLLPSAIGIGGKTRQNDLDIAFQFTFFVGANSESGFGTTGASPLGNAAVGGSSQSRAGDGNSINVRQAYMTFGDASWGTIKAGRDLGVFGSDAILSDMTLLGVGVGAGGPGNSTLGRIGSGYVYADWMGQIQYQSPNWNGIQFTVAAREPMRNQLAGLDNTEKSKIGFDGKVTYDFAANDVTGRVWASAISQKHERDAGGFTDYTSHGYDVGAKIAAGGFGLVGYYYDGRGLDTQSGQQLGGLQFGLLGSGKTDDKGGYVQATYKIPAGTKLGVSYGISQSDNATAARNTDFENKSWIVGAYHPLTKSLNLVAEYSRQDVETKVTGLGKIDGEAKTVSLGAILFF
jgi:predicted porin